MTAGSVTARYDGRLRPFDGFPDSSSLDALNSLRSGPPARSLGLCRIQAPLENMRRSADELMTASPLVVIAPASIATKPSLLTRIKP